MTFNPKKVYDFELEKTLDEKVLVRELLPAVEKKQKRSIEIDVTNTTVHLVQSLVQRLQEDIRKVWTKTAMW